MEAGIQQFYLLLGQALIVLFVGWIGVSVRGVYSELRSLNGRLRTLEERVSGHVALDDVRMNDLHELVRQMIASLREARNLKE